MFFISAAVWLVIGNVYLFSFSK